ncbi:MAG: 4-hydroxybenzoate octaprenyltransferase [Pseudomonadota bacterium]
MAEASTTPADAAPDNWVDRYAPAAARPYLRLARVDRPIGFWLLALPCWFGLAYAALAGPTPPLSTMVWYAILFGVGALAMRGAGCAYNDIVDRDIDAGVARTAARPLPSGAVSLAGAWIFVVGLCLVGLAVLLQFNRATIAVGLASIALVAAYPFMKRVTWWPQAWLGLTFNWGAVVGFTAATGGVTLGAMLVYAACFFWTLGYDTVYAHQDKDDDALIGVKSSARALGAKTPAALLGFYGAAIALLTAAGLAADAPLAFFAALAAPAAHFAWQRARLDIDDGARCLAVFKSNREAGLLVLAALLLAASASAS